MSRRPGGSRSGVQESFGGGSFGGGGGGGGEFLSMSRYALPLHLPLLRPAPVPLPDMVATGRERGTRTRPRGGLLTRCGCGLSSFAAMSFDEARSSMHPTVCTNPPPPANGAVSTNGARGKGGCNELGHAHSNTCN